jgi:xylan 1,4-beta-xylosidase
MRSGMKVTRRTVLGSAAAGVVPAFIPAAGFAAGAGHPSTSPPQSAASTGKLMNSRFNTLPRVDVTVDAGEILGPFEWQRHCLSHGGINSKPLPARVIEGARLLQLPLLRTFMQEYLNIYPAAGRFDWTKADPYMRSLQATGAKVVAALTIKPPPLFPQVDQKIWQPTDRGEWQKVIAAVAKRYSVDLPIVTYWEVGNETDIGENGGCPMLVNSVDDYYSYYRTHVEAIRSVFPQARIGGPAMANPFAQWVEPFLEKCRTTGTQLDFISWHVYNDMPSRHGEICRHFKQLADRFSNPPELFVTEWNKGFDPVSVEEMAFEPQRAAHTAATIFELMDAGVGRSFYYHVWDQTNYSFEFEPFFENPVIMTKHWNEQPHRFGLFGVNEEVRPQYFVFQMLGRMGSDTVLSSWEYPGLTVRAVRGDKKFSVMVVNLQTDANGDLIVKLNCSHLTHSRKQLRTYRIDNQRRWDAGTLELLPLETREVDTYPEFSCQVYSPQGSVAMLSLEELA